MDRLLGVLLLASTLLGGAKDVPQRTLPMEILVLAIMLFLCIGVLFLLRRTAGLPGLFRSMNAKLDRLEAGLSGLSSRQSRE